MNSYITGDCYDRNGIHICRCNSGTRFVAPGPDCCQTHTNFSCCSRISVCCMRSSLFMGGQDMLDFISDVYIVHHNTLESLRPDNQIRYLRPVLSNILQSLILLHLSNCIFYSPFYQYYFAFGTSRIAPRFPDVTIAAYLARYPVVTFGSLGCHFLFLLASSSSETSSSFQFRNIDLDDIAFLNQSDRSANCCLW